MMAQTLGLFVIFVFQPFIGFILSLKYLPSKSAKFFFAAFVMLWGYSQSFSYTPADVYRIGANFCQYPIEKFSTILNMFEEGKAIDAYLLTTNFIVHQYTNNPKIYFALLGLIYGIFCCETVSSLIKERRDGCRAGHLHILFLLFATASFANLSMPRYWTAAWMTAFLFLKITQGKKIWGILSLFLSITLPLIHFSYVPIAFALMLLAISKHLSVFFPNILFWSTCIVFGLSFVIPETVIGGLIPQEMLDDSAKLSSKYGYVSGGHDSGLVIREVSAYREVNSLVTKSFHFTMKLGSFLLLLYFYSRKRVIRKNRKTWMTYTSVLVVAMVVYFMSIIPSTGWRYINVLWMLLFILLHRYYDVFRPKRFGRLLLPLYVMNIYTISFMFYVTYRTVDLLLFYVPLPFVIIHGIGFPPVHYV